MLNESQSSQYNEYFYKIPAHRHKRYYEKQISQKGKKMDQRQIFHYKIKFLFQLSIHLQGFQNEKELKILIRKGKESKKFQKGNFSFKNILQYHKQDNDGLTYTFIQKMVQRKIKYTWLFK
ncbi:unnamed protein product [Paramecium primaurelia]|uniref:Uncharacterized protein n=1 Tax=Paramecium primaurelia TaxID=5886 RepID=A0A8S1QR32_PARPR|nr:unnamed protein product [Paramecium primaurelia]